MRRLLGVLVLALLLYRPAHAEMTVQEYLGTPATGTKHDVTVLWLSGIELGLSWANIFYQHEGFPPLYCPPEHVALTHDQVVSILDEYLKSDEAVQVDKTAVGLALLFALKRAFPCPPK